MSTVYLAKRVYHDKKYLSRDWQKEYGEAGDYDSKMRDSMRKSDIMEDSRDGKGLQTDAFSGQVNSNRQFVEKDKKLINSLKDKNREGLDANEIQFQIQDEEDEDDPQAIVNNS